MLSKQNLPSDAAHGVQNSIPIKIEGGAYQSMTFYRGYTWGSKLNSYGTMVQKILYMHT